MKPTTAQKAERLFRTGRVTRVPIDEVFTVEGDTATYIVVIGEDMCHCECPAHGECSHLLACRMQQADDELSPQTSGAGVAGTTRRPAQEVITP